MGSRYVRRNIVECFCYRDRESIKFDGTMESKKGDEMSIIIGIGI